MRTFKQFRSLIAFIATAALVSTSALAVAQTCPTNNEIVDPAPFVWTYQASPEPHYVGTLEYGQATFNINGESLTTRAYRQQGQAFSIPGPTMHMAPGNKYVLRFANLLDYELPSTDENTFKDPNITNLHTHGLHISGESPGDDVLRVFEGGFGGDYVYDIPGDHMGGSYWYHAHHHGSTYLQVSTGGFGYIIIDDSGDQIPANVAAMEERQLLIAYLDTGAAGTGGDTLVSGTLPAGWTVNGTVNGDICMPPDTWQHWRVLLADADARSKDVTVGAGCEVKLLARDGVWRTSAPKDLPTRSVNITGASRADLAVRCSANSDITVDNGVVANILVAGASDPGPHPYAADGVSMWSSFRPDYLRDLRNETVVNSENVSMGARTLNGSKFDHTTPTFTLPADAVQEWSISGAVNHPFHLHVYHVQAQNGCGGDFEVGEYYDTVATSCDVRFDLNDLTSSPYAGKTIMHCHILGHEDRGAMGWMDVIGGDGPPLFPGEPGATPYSEYYSLGGGVNPPAAPSNLSASNPTSSTIDLAWMDNSNNEDGFDIERSPDGVNFNYIASVGADSTTYTDMNLSSETTYWYRVLAFNIGGDSAYSNVASATTLAAGNATSVDLGSLDVGTQSIGKGFKVGQATVVVIDDLGGTVQGATVTGDFLGDIPEPGVSGPLTDATGTTIIETTGSAKGSITVTFCVTSITHPTLADWTGNSCASN